MCCKGLFLFYKSQVSGQLLYEPPLFLDEITKMGIFLFITFPEGM